MRKTDGKRSEWEYPFAVAGLNITFELLLMLGLKANDNATPNTPAARVFLELLDSERDDGDVVFESLYMTAFRVLDEVTPSQPTPILSFSY